MTSVSTSPGRGRSYDDDPTRSVAIAPGPANVRFPAVTEPGWYNDEQDPERARWFDGGAWTEHTIVKAEWVGLGQPPSPLGQRPLRPYRPIADPKPFPLAQGSWMVLTGVVVVIVVALLIATRA